MQQMRFKQLPPPKQPPHLDDDADTATFIGRYVSRVPQWESNLDGFCFFC